MSAPPSCGLRLTVALEVRALAAAQRQLAAYLIAGGCAEDVRFRAELVVEEVVMNLIRHARPLGATRAALLALISDGRARLSVEDDGPAFDPLAALLRPLASVVAGGHDGGFGLHLIRRHADEACYARTGAANRLELVFLPRLS